MSADIVEAAKAKLRFEEGIRSRVYPDTKGIPTIGVGFNLRREDAGRRMAEVGANRTALLIGRDELSPDQIEQLLELDVRDCVDDLRILFPGFVTLPSELQVVLVDLRFNLGPARLRDFAQTLDLIRKGKFASAAKRIERTPYAKQVPKRAKRNCAVLRALGDAA